MSGARRGKLAAWTVLVAILSTLAYLGRIFGGRPDPDVLYEYETAVASAVLYAIVLGIVLAIARGGPARGLFALRRPSSWGRAAWLTAAIFFGVLAFGAALEPVLQGGEEQGLTPSGWDRDRAGGYAANFVVVAGLAPLVEELTYRGLGYSLLARFGRAAAIALVGVAFGLAHGLFEALPVLVAFGMGLAYLRDRTNSVVPCILLHAFFNAFALIAAVVV